MFNFSKLITSLILFVSFSLTSYAQDPAVTLSVDSASFDEGSSVNVTGTIASAQDSDVLVPFLVTGTALADTDFTTSFSSKGATTKLNAENLTNAFESFLILSDGRYLNDHTGNNGSVFDPSDQSLTSFSTTPYTNIYHMERVGDIIYYRDNDVLGTLDISDLANVTTTVVFDPTDTDENVRSFSNIEGVLYIYTYHNQTGVRKVYTKEGDNDPVYLTTTNDNLISFFKVDNTIYASAGWTFYKFNGTDFINHGNANIYFGEGVLTFNNKAYETLF